MELTYESAYERLEEIVKELESDDISLEDSINKYEEGLKLFKYLNEILNEYEGKVKVLMESSSEMREKEFDNEENKI